MGIWSKDIQKMKILYCKSWIGEFGFELNAWNPILRAEAKKYDFVIVSAPKNSQYLYEFADLFIPLDAYGYSFEEGDCTSPLPILQKVDKVDIITPKDIFKFNIVGKDDWQNRFEKTYRILGEQEPPKNKIDIMYSFRPPKIYKETGQEVPGKHYPIEKAEQTVKLLKKLGLSIGCYGGKENFYFESTEDLREIPLDETCTLLRHAKIAIGPSSGTIHLASLCQCPHITWLCRGHPCLKQRYLVNWNPFHTKCKFLDSKMPTPEMILLETKKMLAKE